MGIAEKGLGNLLIASRSFHFFNKTDFEKYLVKGELKVKSMWVSKVRAIVSN